MLSLHIPVQLPCRHLSQPPLASTRLTAPGDGARGSGLTVTGDRGGQTRRSRCRGVVTFSKGAQSSCGGKDQAPRSKIARYAYGRPDNGIRCAQTPEVSKKHAPASSGPHTRPSDAIRPAIASPDPAPLPESRKNHSNHPQSCRRGPGTPEGCPAPYLFRSSIGAQPERVRPQVNTPLSAFFTFHLTFGAAWKIKAYISMPCCTGMQFAASWTEIIAMEVAPKGVTDTYRASEKRGQKHHQQR